MKYKLLEKFTEKELQVDESLYDTLVEAGKRVNRHYILWNFFWYLAVHCLCLLLVGFALFGFYQYNKGLIQEEIQEVQKIVEGMNEEIPEESLQSLLESSDLTKEEIQEKIQGYDVNGDPVLAE